MEAPPEVPLKKPGYDTAYQPGYGTTYSESYVWSDFYKSEQQNKNLACRPNCNPTTLPYTGPESCKYPPERVTCCVQADCTDTGRDPAIFKSDKYPCVYRETVIQKDDRGKYVHPFIDVVTKSDGRRLQYDPTHPEMIYSSQWSSELADPPGPYSFPTTTGLDPEIPWRKELQWQVDSEVGKWPTDLWTTWTKIASSPHYDGEDDQVEYSKYKMKVP